MVSRDAAGLVNDAGLDCSNYYYQRSEYGNTGCAGRVKCWKQLFTYHCVIFLLALEKEEKRREKE